MILCVNPNAAIDKTAVVENFECSGGVVRPKRMMALAGGKGNNVARVLRTLGAEAVVTGWLGGHSGMYIRSELEREGIRDAYVNMAENSRTCLAIVDTQRGALCEINENGLEVTPAEWADFLANYERLLTTCSVVALCGSVPPGVPRDIYAQLIERARAAGVKSILDSSGDTLRLGIAAQPTLVKPNQHEMRTLLDRALDDSIAAAAEAAREVAARHNTQVVVSLGAQGAAAIADGHSYHAPPPAVNVVSTVGSGDAMVACLAYGMEQGMPFAESLRLSIAAGSANTLQLGAGVVHRTDIERLRQDVRVTEIAM
jgi:tagatose 6-phosphate kinase